MTEEQIERAVERRIDAVDRAWLKPGCTWTQAEYDAEIRAVDQWAQQQYRTATRA
jgi:hypothetical protein